MGAIIEITDSGSWRPIDPRMSVHKTATYNFNIVTAQQLQLLEHRADGTDRTFLAMASKEQSEALAVSMPGTDLEWTLVRDKPASALLVGLRLSFADRDAERCHALEAHLRDFHVFVTACGFLALLVMWEFLFSSVWSDFVSHSLEFRIAAWSRVALLVVLVLSVVAADSGFLYTDSSAIVGATLSSCIMHGTSASHIAAALNDGPSCTARDLAWEAPRLLFLVGLTCATHMILTVRTSRSWFLPAGQVVSYLVITLYIGSDCISLECIAASGFLLAFVGTGCWVRRWQAERLERSEWAEQRKRELQAVRREMNMDMVRTVEHSQQVLDEMHSVADSSPTSVKPVLSSASGGVAVTATSAASAPPLMQKKLSGGQSQAWRPASSVMTREASTELQRPVCVPPPPFIEHGFKPVPSPNKLLARTMAGRRCDTDRVWRMANRIREADYGLREFFEDSQQAFPELSLFFACTEQAQATAAEVEYQRTIGALFAVYWMVRLDRDGKEGFCLGVDENWRVLSLPGKTPSGSRKAFVKMADAEKREAFLTKMNWASFAQVASEALSIKDKEGKFSTERIAAMLSLTAFHDIFKVPDLCPTVQEEHAPYLGYAAGAMIGDHDIALSYVMEHFSSLLPSFDWLSGDARHAVLFSQAKMQFNHGWFVQAEAPAGVVVGHLKRVMSTARPGDISFYFFHWFTDLAGAEGTPRAGAEKFVLKFPHAIMREFIWSIPYLRHLEDKRETIVVEAYLKARWAAMFQAAPIPSGPSSIAQLRLAVMAQQGASKAVSGFHNFLSPPAQETLSVEMARTAVIGQVHRNAPKESLGGPAFLVYYGPALLQRCQDDQKHMELALCCLTAVYRAARRLYPVRPEAQGEAVTVEITQLKSESIEQVFSCKNGAKRSIWTVVRKNDKEAVCKAMSAAELNASCVDGTVFCFLDFDAILEESKEAAAARAEERATRSEPTTGSFKEPLLNRDYGGG